VAFLVKPWRGAGTLAVGLSETRCAAERGMQLIALGGAIGHWHEPEDGLARPRVFRPLYFTTAGEEEADQMTRRDELRVTKALQGADFPADRAALLDYAQTRVADAETLQALRALPDRRYANLQEVAQAVPQEPEGERTGGINR
jgi:hypothetical protein